MLDAPRPWQMNFQNSASPIMEGIVDLHHDIMFFMVFIVFFVSCILIRIVYIFSFEKKLTVSTFSAVTHNTALETIWTIIPAVILVWISIPSFALLYAMDQLVEPVVTFKAIGHQWYWSYEFYDNDFFLFIDFDSYMVSDDDVYEIFEINEEVLRVHGSDWFLKGYHIGWYRLLEVDNRLSLPVHTSIRGIISSTDVLHSWAIPSLGVKLDACPGRLNQVAIFIKREGLYYGQCSEICGVNHGYMPIAVEAISYTEFETWKIFKASSFI